MESRSIIRNNPNEIYKILDDETEFLSNYLQNTDDVYLKIRQRERKKLKLQLKMNKDELTKEDSKELEELTNSLRREICLAESSYPLVWKGVRYLEVIV